MDMVVHAEGVPAGNEPDPFAALLLEADAALAAGQPDAAIAPLLRCMGLDPTSVTPLFGLAEAMRLGGELPEAVRLYRAVIARQPDDPKAHAELGHVLEQLGDRAAAEVALRRAVGLAPGDVEAHRALARLLRQQGRLAEAIRHLTAAIAANPDSALARWERAQLWFLAGDLPAGWEDAEARLLLPRHAMPPAPGVPWAGQPIEGQRILLTAEPGLADTIQFARFATLLGMLGADVWLRGPAELLPLLRRVRGTAEVVGFDDPLPACDFHLPLMSVARVLRQGLSSIPLRPYISVTPLETAQWRAVLATTKELQVGLMWLGEAERSIPAAVVVPLLGQPGVRFHALHPGVPGVGSLGDLLRDPADAAGALSALDLVITIDGEFAHLAGALGRPTWLLLPADPDWRWLLGRSDSPWYAQMRLFRQASAGDWSVPLAAVAAELAALVAHQSHSVPATG